MAAGDRWERQARLFEALAPFLPGPPNLKEEETFPLAVLTAIPSGLFLVDALLEAARLVLEQARGAVSVLEGPATSTAATAVPNPYLMLFPLRSGEDVLATIAWTPEVLRITFSSREKIDRNLLILLERADGAAVVCARVRPEDIGRELELDRPRIRLGLDDGGWNLRVIELDSDSGGHGDAD